MTLTYEQKVYKWASSHYLAEEVPSSFFKLSDQEQLTYYKIMLGNLLKIISHKIYINTFGH